MALCASYFDTDQTGAWCIWEGESPQQIKEALTEGAPSMSTEVKPVIQFFPPSQDLYQILYQLVS